jgi:hypothetical protein
MRSEKKTREQKRGRREKDEMKKERRRGENITLKWLRNYMML